MRTIPGEVVGLVMLGIFYLTGVAMWYGFHTSSARSAYRWAEQLQGFTASSLLAEATKNLERAQELAKRARKAPIWLPYSFMLIARNIHTSVTDQGRLARGATPLHAEQRKIEIELMEADIARLKREQDAADDREEFHRGGGL